MTRRRSWLLALALPLVACEETTITPEATDGTATEDTTATVQATSPTLPPTTVPVPTEVALGTTLTINPGSHKVTAHTYKAPIRSTNQFNTPEPGNQFVAVDVEQCAGPSGDRIGPNPYEFQIAMPDNTRMRPANNAGLQMPTLESTPLQPGECVRGWINYEVPTDPAPRYLIYSSGGASARWRLT